jgi:hypothetical protein
MLHAAHFIIRLILGTGDKQLITALARLALQIVGDAGIAGVFQIGNHQPYGARSASPQPCGDGVGMVVMFAHHRHHFFYGLIADTILLCLAINDVARRGAGNPRQTRNFIQFHYCPL